jgi:hypothetical protein
MFYLLSDKEILDTLRAKLKTIILTLQARISVIKLE